MDAIFDDAEESEEANIVKSKLLSNFYDIQRCRKNPSFNTFYIGVG